MRSACAGDPEGVKSPDFLRPRPNPYRLEFKKAGGTIHTGAHFAQDDEFIAEGTTGRVAGIVLEPIQGWAGSICPPHDFFPKLGYKQGVALNAFPLGCEFMYAGSGIVLDRIGTRRGLTLVIAMSSQACGLHSPSAGAVAIGPTFQHLPGVGITVLMLSISAFGVGIWAGNLDYLAAGVFPSESVASIHRLAGSAGAVGGILFNLMVGHCAERRNAMSVSTGLVLLQPLGVAALRAWLRPQVST